MTADTQSPSPGLARPKPRVVLPRARPLLVRKGARYTCFGDGLCCTDIHALGPVTRREKLAVDLIEPGMLIRHKDLGEPVFATKPSGADAGSCVLRSSRGCELHARHGADAKPAGCSRFPFGLVATPDGGRITTEHRCPCRTLGTRPEITPESALSSLVDAAGRLSPNGKVGPRVTIADGKTLAWARFARVESAMIDTLLAGADPLLVLDVKPFGRVEGVRWKTIAKEMKSERDGTKYGEAMVWFSNALLALTADEKLPLSDRPWSVAYDIAEARSPVESASAVLNDWLADLLWSLDWVFSSHSFHGGRRELATLYVVAQAIMQRLIKARVRPDRAAAEALTIVELSRQSGAWERVQLGL
ncbi:MAG: hypothetical protein JWN48_860 [Myxococcaceae bacterium]|nr:hypothetical protein [Myxococcaceae bacterium]